MSQPRFEQASLRATDEQTKQAGLSFDDALVLYVGQLGRGQLLLMLTASLFWISVSRAS